MEKDEIIRLLELFRYKENDRPGLNNYLDVTWNSNKYVATTTPHHFIIIKKSIYEFTPSGFLNLSAHIPSPNCEVEISVNEIINKVSQIRLVEVEQECECSYCSGTGEVKEGFYSSYCRNCDGYGFVGNGQYETIIDEEVRIKIRDSLFNNGFIAKLLEVCQATNSKNIFLIHQKDERVNLFKINNEILIGIMPMRPAKDEEFVTIDLKNPASA
ncbi:hypothetical protein SAMN04515674_101446 [Pseudarcicella hirudinis]|uniref:Uncharacterized protein n=1 Tax=Pseudarcicella hirudinis TaxID=1079859 RepID=A0A1I5MTX9_9BACT|nr:hypothetical protein [Pseudarcicella hirudinis]SFP12985.1 hypothetical protein SAMN04515674_101446 [Pseudarcicella hirudinis]